MKEQAPGISLLSARALRRVAALGLAVLVAGCGASTRGNANADPSQTSPTTSSSPTHTAKHTKSPSKPSDDSQHSAAPKPSVSPSAMRRILGTSDSLPRCFTKPLTHQPGHAGNVDLDSLSLPVAEDNTITGDPGKLSTAARTKILGAMVRVTAGDREGSGFLTKDSEGQTVIVTAAHVVLPGTVGDVRITDNKGRNGSVENGCYIYDDATSQKKVSTVTTAVTEDLAVLVPSTALGSSTLSPVSTMPARGQWGHFVNFQKGHGPGNPAEYEGLEVFQPPANNLQLLTGLAPGDTPDQLEDQTLLPGGSGGPVVNDSADLIGMSYASSPPYQTADDLTVSFNVSFPGATYGAAGIEPVSAWLIDDGAIGQALSADQLKLSQH